jgi:outer membrane protein
VVEVAGAPAPRSGAFDGPAGPPAYEPRLPSGTPGEQVERDAAQPITTLPEALERSYWTNPQLLSERAQTRSVDYRLPQARGQYGPQLQYSFAYGYQQDDIDLTTTNSMVRAGWATTATAVLTQPVFTFGRLRANEDTARAQIAFQRASLRATEQQTLLQSINAYASVLRDRAGVAIAQDNLQLLSRQFVDERTRLEQRESTATDVGQTRSRLELAKAQLLAAQGQAASSDASFLRYIGAPAGNLAPPNPLVLPVRTLEDAYAYADAHNPVIASAYARERVSRSQLELAKANLLPRIDLRGQATRGTVSPYSDDLKTTELRGTVTISGTIDSGIRQSQIGEAAAANDADWRLLDEAIRENREELADAWNSWQSQLAAVSRLQVAVDLAQQTYEGAVLQQRAGLRTVTEILELARDLLQVRSSLNSAMASAYVQQARVLAAMGALEHKYLLPDAQDYDAEAHYDQTKRLGDVPLLTPLIRALDSATTPPRVDRPVRDPEAPVAVGAGRIGVTE